MADLVVTVPMNLWRDWIEEGDAAGEPATDEEWGFFVGPSKPPIIPRERLYVVAHGLLRGYAPVTRVAKIGHSWAIGRRGNAVAVTIPESIKGFRGFRKRWWERDVERPFPMWEFARVPSPISTDILLRHQGVRGGDPGFYGSVMTCVEGWIAECGLRVDMIVPLMVEQFELEFPDAVALAIWATTIYEQNTRPCPDETYARRG
jgi:hypothetical protein